MMGRTACPLGVVGEAEQITLRSASGRALTRFAAANQYVDLCDVAFTPSPRGIVHLRPQGHNEPHDLIEFHMVDVEGAATALVE